MFLAKCLGKKTATLVLLIVFLAASLAYGQSDSQELNAILKEEILAPAVADFQIRQYLVSRVAPLPKPPVNAQEWTAEAQRLRHHVLDVAFHGWPKDWVESPPK
ncbi:MAG TPA: hypothetical protein VKM93_10380, partial [Terriglobia bacterium]|nr:hypothetical protein [Terriglobia bacterium]